MKHALSVVAFAVGVFALMYDPADAVAFTITFNDTTDTATVDISNVPVGVNAQSQPGATAESVIVTITGAFLAPSQPTNFTLGLTELPGLEQVSDLITLTKQETGFSVTFSSDTESSLGTCATISCQPEFNPGTTTPPNPFLTRDLFTAAGAPISGGLTINAFSDPDISVPEPTTLLLLGAGLAGLGGLRLRRSRPR